MNNTKGSIVIQKPSRDIQIELLHLVSCLMVIMIHTRFSDFTEEGGADLPAKLIMCCIADAVAFFFAITGCFWFDKEKPFVQVEEYSCLMSFGCVFCVFLIIFNVCVGEKAGRVTAFLSKHAFYIYLIHTMVIGKLFVTGAIGGMREWVSAIPSTIVGHAVYMILIALLVFAISLPFAILAKAVENLIRKKAAGFHRRKSAL